jgi:hypothetical protein
VDAGALAEIGDIQPRDRHILAGDRQAVTTTGLAAVDLDQGRAGVARLGGAVDQDGLGDGGQRRSRRDHLHTRAGDGKVDRVLVAAVAALESRIAWRREPGPLSAVLVTVKVDSSVRSSMTSRRGRSRNSVQRLAVFRTIARRRRGRSKNHKNSSSSTHALTKESPDGGADTS